MTWSQDFRAALLTPDAPEPKGLSNGANAPAGRRYAVYRNNVAVSLREALHASFPVLVKLIGTQNFDMLAGVFLRAHPPKSALMMHYGADMPAFLTDFAPLQHIAYLPDIAQLEGAIRQSYHSADASVLDPARLGSITPDALDTARITLAPSLRMVCSKWPIFDIWRYNMQSDAEKPRNIAQNVLILRAQFDPAPHPISAADAAWITATQNGGNTRGGAKRRRRG